MGYMETKEIIARNLAELRKHKKITQGDLATQLNYSDKSISKWEHGEALPDIEVLLQICDIYGITLNDIVKENAVNNLIKTKKERKKSTTNKIIVTWLSVLPIWFIVCFAYVTLQVVKNLNFYPLFIWAVPASSIVLIVFNSIWGKRKYTFFIVSILIWSLLSSIYIQLFYLDKKLVNLWPIFILGIPLQIAIILWSQIKKTTLNE